MRYRHRHRHRLNRGFAATDRRIIAQSSRLVMIWVLRLLVVGKGYEVFIEKDGYNDDNLARFLGLDEPDPFHKKTAQKDLFKLYEQKESEQDVFEKKEANSIQIKNNIARLSKLTGFSPEERDVLAFALLFHASPLLREAAQNTGLYMRETLEVALNRPQNEIRRAISAKSTLMKSGVMEIEEGMGDGPWDHMIEVDFYKDDFVGLMLAGEFELEKLLEGIAVKAPAPSLTLADYEHIKDEIDVLRDYLSQIMKSKKCGVNILIYGAPGVGKTQLARALSKALGFPLLEITSDEESHRSGRLKAYQLTQILLQKSRHFILFDEVEGLLCHRMSMFGSLNSAKAKINQILENNCIPSFWVANSTDDFDKAFTRRFDICLELSIPPKAKRVDMLRKASQNKLEEDVFNRLAHNNEISPAVITRAISVCEEIGGDSKQIEKLINASLDAQGYQKTQTPPLPSLYDPDFVNASGDLRGIYEGLSQTKQGRLCFYGPPGTGKTAFGCWLAEKLNKELIIKRASDLLSMFVGENEKNIRKAFRQARKAKAVLLIDEADSFLFDRRIAKRSWEVSMVNEILTQMENFEGIFIASTNLMDGLDQAVFRRFDMKIKFDYLLAEQALQLFLKHCALFGFRANDAVIKKLQFLSQLTPGDFAVARRQRDFGAINNAQELVNMLQQEIVLKEANKAKIGFA